LFVDLIIAQVSRVSVVLFLTKRINSYLGNNNFLKKNLDWQTVNISFIR